MFSWPKERKPDEVRLHIEEITSNGMLSIGFSKVIDWPEDAQEILFGSTEKDVRNLGAGLITTETPPC